MEDQLTFGYAAACSIYHLQHLLILFPATAAPAPDLVHQPRDLTRVGLTGKHQLIVPAEHAAQHEGHVSSQLRDVIEYAIS